MTITGTTERPNGSHGGFSTLDSHSVQGRNDDDERPSLTLQTRAATVNATNSQQAIPQDGHTGAQRSPKGKGEAPKKEGWGLTLFDLTGRTTGEGSSQSSPSDVHDESNDHQARRTRRKSINHGNHGEFQLTLKYRQRGSEQSLMSGSKANGGSVTHSVNGGDGSIKDHHHHHHGNKDDDNDSVNDKPAGRLARFRAKAGAIVNNELFQSFIVVLIIINAIMMGLATFSFVENNPDVSSKFEMIDTIFLSMFTAELCLQFSYHGLHLFQDGWLVFDFIIVVMSWSLESFQIVRTFRIFRALRLVTRIKVLKDLVSALLSVGPRMSAITCLLLLVLYIYAVMCTTLFRDLYKDGHTEFDYFSRLDLSMWTLLVMMTLDWGQVAREIMHVYPLSWLVFVPYIMLTSFIVYNLIIAVVCDSVTIIEMRNKDEDEQDEAEYEQNKIQALKQKVAELQQQNEIVLRGIRYALDEMGLDEPPPIPDDEADEGGQDRHGRHKRHGEKTNRTSQSARRQDNAANDAASDSHDGYSSVTGRFS